MKRPANSALICALAIVLAAAGGCAAAKESGGAMTGGGGSTGSGAGGAGGTAACQVNVVAVTPASFDGLVAGAGARLRVRGALTGLPAASFSWAWSVTFADGTPVAFVTVAGEPSVVELALDRAGSYTIAVDLTGATVCGGRTTVLARRSDGKLAAFHLRFSPQAGGEPAQTQDVQVYGGTPSGGNVLVLSAGALVPLDTRDATSGQPVGAYLRLSDAAQGLTIETRREASGPAAGVRLPDGSFDLLVVPDGDRAPVLRPAAPPAALAAMGALALASGAAVAGSVRDAAGPVAGAHVVLRAGALPSTLATTGADGAFTLRAAAGTYGATVTRELAGGTLEATLPAAPGVVVGAAGGPALNVEVASFATATLTMSIAANDGASLAAGTHVLLESDAPVSGLVQFNVGGEARPVAARLRGDFTPAPDGSLTLAGLPRARYRATVVPGTGMADAITAVAGLDLSAGDPPSQAVLLRRKVALSGRLLSDAQVGGIALMAIDATGNLLVAISGLTGALGSFEIAVHPDRTYALRVLPGPERAVAPAVFGPLAVPAGGLMGADQQMPSALLYAGRVLDHSAASGSPGTLVQAYCQAGAAGCGDPSTPVAEAITAGDGTFTLRLPDPGTN